MKKIFQNNFIIFLIYNIFNEVIDYIKFNIIYKYKYRYTYLHKSTLFEKLKKKKKIKDSKVCHIIGAGGSLNSSIDKISKKDFVLGCNLAVLADLNFDFYTIEFASNDKITEPKHITSYLVKRKLLKNNTVVIFKNLISEKIDRNFLKKTYQKSLNFITDYSWRCFNKKQLKFYLENKIFGKTEKFYQYNSTLVLLISIAYNLKFKKIILHGVDFGGKYFYSSKVNLNIKKISHIKELKDHENNNISKQGVYTDFKDLNMPGVFKQISNILEKKGINLLAASRSSKSSKFLRVYKNFI
ncbi:hypothetical protein [Candidatus Pelagibacter communis]|jgi:hypothetical protein|uniref:hypothetical protein n=1 Tax=Pelagibacter ubique TaxID=198252 RepID=UPI000404D300|nr:hypothetical protein [Candidatus Pelagibacter ubique]